MGRRMITVEGIGKRYYLGGVRGLDTRQGLWKNVRSLMGARGKPFWALRNINFTVDEGQVFGVVGRNGAGKSTLLKILSRIVAPTEGGFTINGKLSSLLEVGTGFHGDLTGRENTFLNGTILGMRRAEVKAKFDEIVEFSGVSQFIDTPVKYYSSGQKVRLAFAVAAHLEPEVLIIDEVLAVGDVEFQRKCLGKMKDVATSGRTVLFVSHNMSAVNSLCEQCILLEEGQLEMIGPTADVTRQYLNRGKTMRSGEKDVSAIPLQRDRSTHLLNLRWVDENRNTVDNIKVTQRFGLEITHRVLGHNVKPQPVLRLLNENSELVFVSSPGLESTMRYDIGTHTTTVWIPANLLNAGNFTASVWLVTWLPYQPHQALENIFSITVLDDVESPTYPITEHRLGGLIRPPLEWEVASR